MKRDTLLAALLSALILPACAQDAVDGNPRPDASELPGPADGVLPSMMQAGAEIIGSTGEVIGSANVLDGPNGLLLQIEINAGGLAPGWHGLHLHQIGDCSDVGVFKASGGHVGMIEGGHGLLNPKGPEAGDIPNIWAAASGAAGYEAFTTLTSLGQLMDEDGTAIIIHENRDDHLSQPIGGAGGRVACGVINAG